MQVKSVRPVGRRKVYDITVDREDYNGQNYALENGVITHNTGRN